MTKRNVPIGQKIDGFEAKWPELPSNLSVEIEDNLRA
jgi:hypothetical protein